MQAGAILLLAGTVLAGTVLPQDPARPADDAPITTAGGEIGELLRRWHAEGTAAGNRGDFYDNRDRGHSALPMGPHPQLGKISYTEEERKKGLDWAFCPLVRPAVVFGNSSTSAGPREGGSNARRAYADPRGLAILLAQYTHNNLYVYPEHRDHDPGHNGVPEGFGDLFPTNTPFLLISQGSSGSDQPFLKALAFTLAAFRPEVKKKLVQGGLLMPVLQMILRWTHRNLRDLPGDYLTGRAHPTVFEGAGVDPLKMANMAHEMTLETLPPVALLRVLEEDTPRDGLDFFEPGATERHFDSPFVVARIFRGRRRIRRLVVSAEESRDPNHRPLTFHWAVLRGDPEEISIRPLNASGSRVEILVPHPRRRPVAPGSPLESNRVDLGAFVHNGVYFSPPSFLTWFGLDHEARTYDEKGRPLEIGYQTGETIPSVRNWPGLFALLDSDSWPARLLRDRLKPDERDALRRAAARHPELSAAVKSADEEKKRADEARRRAEGRKADDPQGFQEADRRAREAQKALERAEKTLQEALAAPTSLLRRVLGEMLDDPLFAVDRRADLEAFLKTAEGKARRGALKAAQARLERLGIRPPAFLRPGNPTDFERAMLGRFHGEILSNVLFPGVVECRFQINYVQPEISEPPYWRDVYRYTPEGAEDGWIRYGDETPREFTSDGLWILEKDSLGRPLRARTMTYQPEAPAPAEGNRRRWPYWRKTLQIPGDEIRHFEYSGDTDRKGRVSRVERIEAGAAR